MSEQSIESLLESIWSRREFGIKLPIDTDFLRPITPQDIEYLRNNNYPFLQIVNVEADFKSDEPNPDFITLPNGWVLFDYGDAMCTSYSTRYVFRKNEKDSLALLGDLDLRNKNKVGDEEEGGGEEGGEGGGGADQGGKGGATGEGGGSGTVVKQQFEAAFAMIKEAKIKGWQAIELINGNTLMKLYAWIAAKELNIDLYGFTPTDEQLKHYNATNKRVDAKKWKWGISRIIDKFSPANQPD